MRKFLAAAAIALQFGPASAAPDSDQFTFDTANGTFQTADLGGRFDHLNIGYPMDKLVQEIDTNFVAILEDLWQAEINDGDPSLRPDYLAERERYNLGVIGLEGEYNGDREKNLSSIGLCKAQQYHTFFSYYYDSLERFAYDYYELSDKTDSKFSDITRKINQLANQINFEYQRNPDAACRILKA